MEGGGHPNQPLDDKDVAPPPTYVPPTQPPPQYQSQMQQPQPGYYGGQQPQPGYYGGQQPQQMVMVGQPHQGANVTIIQQPQVIRPSNYLALAIVTTICCNLLFGIIAIIFSVLSSSSADEGDLEGARTKGKISLAMSLVGIVATIIIVIFVIIYFTVIVSTAATTAYSYACGYYC